jgi:hypothetical protein
LTDRVVRFVFKHYTEESKIGSTTHAQKQQKQSITFNIYVLKLERNFILKYATKLKRLKIKENAGV